MPSSARAPPALPAPIAAVEDAVDVSMRSLSREEKEKLLSQRGTSMYETQVDESKSFDPWPINTVLSLCVLMHKWFAELLRRMPELSDAQLRHIMFMEHPQPTLRSFRAKYVVHTMVSTSRCMVNELFRDYVNLVKATQQFMVDSDGDEVLFKHLMGQYMRTNQLYFNVLDFKQIRGVSEVPTETVSEAQLQCLAQRRQAHEEPGLELLQKEKLVALKEHHEVFRQSQRKESGT